MYNKKIKYVIVPGLKGKYIAMYKDNSKKININHVKTRNKQLVLKALTDGELKTRAQIAGEISVSSATVGTIIDELLSLGIVTEEKDNSTSVGRKPSLLKIESDKILSLVINLSQKDITFSVMDVHDDAVLRGNYKSNKGIAFEENIKSLLEGIHNQLKEKDLIDFLVGVCICIAGVYDKKADRITSQKVHDLNDINIVKLVQEFFEVKVIVDNDVNLATKSYMKSSEISSDSNMMFVYFGSGIGSSIVLDRRVIHGFSGYAGEIGQMKIYPDRKFEDIASWDEFLNRAIDIFGWDKSADIDEFLNKKIQSNDSRLMELLDEFVDIIAHCVGNVIYMFNPKTIYICGGFNIFGDLLLQKLKSKLSENSIPMIIENLKIEFMENHMINLEVGASSSVIRDWIADFK